MFPSLFDYYRHSPTYAKLLSELDFNVAFAQTYEEKYKFIESFTDHYLTPYEIWLFRLGKNVNENEKKEILQKTLFHFCNDPRLHKNMFYTKYIIQKSEKYISSSEIPSTTCFSFPHSELRKYLMKFETKKRFIPQQKFIKNVKKLEELYWKIKSVKFDDIETWFDLLVVADNFKFLKFNVEHRISFNLTDKRLWKLYIDYLKIADTKELLQVYSKYCRFFLDDFEMKKEYKNATEKYGPAYVSWKNLFDFETFGVFLNDEYNIIDEGLNFVDDTSDYDSDEDMIDGYGILKPKESKENQTFSLPNSLIKNILNKAAKDNPIILRNLHKSYISSDNRNEEFIMNFFGDSFECKATILPCINFAAAKRKIWITTILSIKGHQNLLSHLIKNKKIFRCDARYIKLANQNISLDEFKFLINHGNVEYLKLSNMSINNKEEIKDKNQKILLEEFLILMPKIMDFNLVNLKNLHSNETLSNLVLRNKLINFSLIQIEDILNINDFCHFLTKNAAPFSNFSIKYSSSDFEGVASVFKKIVDNYIMKWDTFYGKPDIDIGVWKEVKKRK